MQPHSFRMKYIFTGIALLCLLAGKAQTTTRHFVDSLPDSCSQSLFLYQSTLRSFNPNNSEDFNKLIKNIKKISIHILDSSSTAKEVDQLMTTLKNEGFKALEDFKELKGKGTILLKDDTYLLMGNGQGRIIIIEMEGAPDLKYKKAIKDADFSLIQAFFQPTVEQLSNEEDKE